MGDKKYKLKFIMTDGTEKSVTFAVPIPQKGIDYFTQADKEELVAMLLAEMNKPSLISFSINGTDYQAEEGMTWGAWVESEYNTGNYVISSDDNGVYFGDPSDSFYLEFEMDEGIVLATDVIVAGHDYYEWA